MALNDQEFGRLTELLETRKNSNLSGLGSSSNLNSPGFVSRISEDLNKRGEKVNDAFFSTDQSFASKTLQLIGQGAGFATDIAVEGAKEIANKTGITDSILKPAAEAVKPVAVDILESDIGKAGLQAIKSGADTYEAWKVEHPEAAGNLEAVVNIGSLLGAGKALQKGGQVAAEGASAVLDTAATATKGVTDVARGVVTGASDLARGASRIPGNIKTNLEARDLARQQIDALPDQVAKEAAMDGVEVPDIQTLYTIADDIKKIELNTRAKTERKLNKTTGNVADEQKPVTTGEVKLSEGDTNRATGAVQRTSLAKELFTTVKDFAAGKTKTDPIEVVGRPIVQRLQTLDKAAEKVGQELGNVAKTLGTVTTKELVTPVFNALKQTPGLSGLKVNNKGILDFSQTTLATAQSKAARAYIQRSFTDAIKPGTGQSKHLIRQEFFNILGGKKKSLANLTDTEDKAINAIRSGLSEVLETKSPRYKVLSNQYRRIITPLQDMRKLMKTMPDVAEDILDMKAGLLARRLTSAAKSNPEIRALLRQLDEALGTKGDTTVNVEALQDLYNILDKYYDISPKTGFKSQVKGAINEATGLFDFVKKTVTNVAGESDVVRQKAIETVFNQLFK